MASLTKPQLQKLLTTALPRPDRITDMDESSKPDAVSFRWFGIDFTVTAELEVKEFCGTHSHGLLMQALLRETHTNH